MTSSASRWQISSERALALRAVVLAVGVAYVLTFVLVAVGRLRLPFSIERDEIGILQLVERILDHQPIYSAPSAHFVPFSYTPLYYYVSAGVSGLLGATGYAPLRAVSLAATLASFAIIGQFVRRETDSWQAGVLALSLFAATYRASGAWFDVARVDSLSVALMLAALYAVRFSRASPGAAAGGALMALAWLTKQTAIFPGIALAAYLVVENRRRGWMFTGAFVGGVAVSSWLLSMATSAWFTFYAFALASHHSGWRAQASAAAHQSFLFGSSYLLGTLPIPFVFASAFLVERIGRRSAIALRSGGFYATAWCATAAGALASLVLQGSTVNAMIPVYALTAVIFGISAHELHRLAAEDDGVRSTAPIWILCLIQFAALAYVPWHLVPSGPDMIAGESLVTISRHAGESPTIQSGPDWSRAEHVDYAVPSAVADLLVGAPADVTRAFQRNLGEAVCASSTDRPFVVDTLLFDATWQKVVQESSVHPESLHLSSLQQAIDGCP